MPLETKAKIVHTLVITVATYRCESRTVKKGNKKNGFIRNKVLEECSIDILDHQKDKQVGPKTN